MKQFLYFACLLLFPFSMMSQGVGIGTLTPAHKLDIVGGTDRTGTHPTGRPLYVTGNMLADTLGIEFRHDNGTQGIGFGFNTMYATGSSISQDLGLKAKGPSGNLLFSTNGIQRAIVSNSGTVGIGVINPQATLTVGRGISPDGTALFLGTNFHSFFNYSTNENTHIRGGKPGSHVILNEVSGLGNVGIGTANPVQKLHVEGKAYVKDSIGIGVTTPHAQLHLSNTVGSRKIVMYEVANNAHQFFGFGVDASGSMRYQTPVTANDHVFYAAASATASNELMRITGTGSVGIGSSSPLQKLHVAGNTYVSGNVGIGTSTISFPLTFADATGDKISLWGQSGNHFGFGIGAALLQIHTDASSSDIAFGHGTSASFTELMRIKGSGSVGIGLNPGNKLDIQAATRTGSHATLLPLYVTGDLGEASNGIEFRHSNGTQGIGFGFATIYAAGSSTSQNLGLAAKGAAGYLNFNTNGVERVRISAAGNVMIGTTTEATGYKLSVNGKIAAEEILVDLHADWPDYVFEEQYSLKSLDQLKTYIEEHNHLPGVPSAKEVSDKGISLGEMNKVLMEKIEELTLYILQQEERIQQLEKSMNIK